MDKSLRFCHPSRGNVNLKGDLSSIPFEGWQDLEVFELVTTSHVGMLPESIKRLDNLREIYLA